MKPPGPIFSSFSTIGGGYLGWKLSTWQQSRTQQRILEIYSPEDKTYWSESMKNAKILSADTRLMVEANAETRRQIERLDKLIAMAKRHDEKWRKWWERERRDRDTGGKDGVEKELRAKEKQLEVDGDGVGSSLV